MNMGNGSPSATSTDKIFRLFDRHYEDLYCYVRRFTPPTETEDICQQVFLGLSQDGVRERELVTKASLLRSARDLLKMKYRPLQRVHRALVNAGINADWKSGEANESTYETRPTTTRWLRKIGREISTLPADLKQSIRLVIAEGLSLQEAAERMGVNQSLVEAWASSGLERLTERMCNNDQQIS